MNISIMNVNSAFQGTDYLIMDMINLRYYIKGMAMMTICILCFHFMRMQGRLQRVLGWVLAGWALSGAKGLLFMIPNACTPLWHDEFLIFDMMLIPACAFLVEEIFHPRYVTWKIVLRDETTYITAIIGNLIYRDVTWLQIISCYSLAYAFFVILMIHREIRKYNKKLVDNYSDIEKYSTRWMHQTMWIFFMFLLVWLIVCFYDYPWADAIYYTLVIVLWLNVGYHINHQETPPPDDRPKEEHEGKLFHPSSAETNICENAYDFSTNTAKKQFETQFIQAFEVDQCYLNPHLTLNDLAKMLGTNRTYLSRYINEELHDTFYGYVNRYRLQKAMQVIINSNYTMEHVAEEAGFNSLSTFRRSFIKQFGYTPITYRTRHMQVKVQND